MMKKTKIHFVLALAVVTVISAGAMAATEQEEALALQARIRTELSTNPATKNLYIQVDTYRDLAVIHGVTPTRRVREMIEDVVKGMDGVGRVYSYIAVNAPNTPEAEALRAENRSLSAASAYDNTPLFDAPEENVNLPVAAGDDVSREVSIRLGANELVAMHDFRVDAYNGLIILHGKVPLSDIARDAEKIAAQTPGVRKVLSFIKSGDTETSSANVSWPYAVDVRHNERSQSESLKTTPDYVKFEEPSNAR